MNLRPQQRRPHPGVDITPLIDVVFLLLIFFMVSTTFDRETQISIKLPEATGEEPLELEQELNVTIDADGTFYVNQREVVNTEFKTLKQAMQMALKDKGKLPVIINADAKTPYQSVVTAMDAASQLGLSHLTFAAHQPTGD